MRKYEEKSITVPKYVWLGTNIKGGYDKDSKSEDGHMWRVGCLGMQGKTQMGCRRSGMWDLRCRGKNK